MTAPTGAEDLRGLARRGSLSLAGAGVSAVVNLLLIVVVTRNVDAEVAGALFSATSLFVVLEAVCALGTATGVVYFISRSRALAEHRRVRETLRLAVVPVVLASLLGAAALAGLAPEVVALIGVPDDDGEGTLFVRLLAAFLPVAVLYDVLVAATQGFHTMTPTVLLEKVGRPTLQVVAMGLAVVLGGPAWVLPLAWVAPYAVTLVLSGLALRRLLRRHAVAPAQQSGGGADGKVGDEVGPLDRRTFWSFTAPRGIAAAAQLSLQRLDIVLVAAYLGAAPAAVYTAATRFVVLGQLGSQAVALAVQPKLSELMAQEDLVSTRRVYRTSTAWVVAVTWPVHLVVAMLAPVLLELFGPGYSSGRVVTVVLAVAMLVATGCGMVTMLLLMAGRSRENLLNVGIALVVNLGLNVLLIPRMGIEGAAVAWAVAIVISNLLPLWQVRRAFGLDPFGPAVLKVALLALVCLVPAPAVAWLSGASTTVAVSLVAVGLVVYAAGLGRLRREIALDDLVRSVVRKLRPGRR